MMTPRALLETLLNDLNLFCSVLEPIAGYTVDTYPVRGQIKQADLEKLTEDVSGRLQSPVRVSYTNAGQLALELAASKRKPVTYSDIGQSDKTMMLPLLLGKTNQGKELWTDLASAPHLLIAGTTGSGKSNWLSSALAKLISLVSPDKLQLVLIDPKKVELAAFRECPHLITDVVTSSNDALNAVMWLVTEMNSRYDQLAVKQLNNISQVKDMPRIVLIVDELAQLFGSLDKDDAKTLESNLQQLTQLARAVGIHCVLATQKPSSQIFSSVIKANIPARVAFKSLNHHESIAILEQTGSQQLLGHGDALYLSQQGLTRFQAPLITQGEMHKALVTYPRATELASLTSLVTSVESTDDNSSMAQATELATKTGRLTANMLISAGICGKNRASRLMQELRDLNIIAHHDYSLGYSPYIGTGEQHG